MTHMINMVNMAMAQDYEPPKKDIDIWHIYNELQTKTNFVDPFSQFFRHTQIVKAADLRPVKPWHALHPEAEADQPQKPAARHHLDQVDQEMPEMYRDVPSGYLT